MSGTLFPVISFGQADSGLPDWRHDLESDEDPDDDGRPHRTPPSVVTILGFDPQTELIEASGGDLPSFDSDEVLVRRANDLRAQIRAEQMRGRSANGARIARLSNSLRMVTERKR